MNDVQRINAITPQMTFKAKPGNRKAIHEFIDKTNDLTMEILNKELRSHEEYKENIIRKSILSMNEAIDELLLPKSIIKIHWNFIKEQTAVGLGKFLVKCDRAIKKIF